jgi:hypothetical protein
MEKRCGGAKEAAAGKAVKKRLDLTGYSKFKKEVRNNMKPPMVQYISLKDIFDLEDRKYGKAEPLLSKQINRQ